MLQKMLMVLPSLILTLLPAWADTFEPALKVGDFKKIYDPSVGEAESWYINDHYILFGPDHQWHMFGITHQEPADPMNEKFFAHATSPDLLASPWNKEPFALAADPKAGEVHLWAPSVVPHNGLYYMFYCAGGPKNTEYRIHVATSTDMKTWTRYPGNPIIVDGYDARDPFVLKDKDQFILYYTATEPREGGNHVVACMTSKDLLHWKNKKICFKDPSTGTWGGPTESPFVIRRGNSYYLFVGPRDNVYSLTEVFKSNDPLHFDVKNIVGRFDSHAAEVVRDFDGNWYASRAGWGQGGLYLAPLTWLDGLDDAETSMPIPAHGFLGE